MSFTLIKKMYKKVFIIIPILLVGFLFLSPRSRFIIANSLNNLSMFFYESVEKKDYDEWIIDIKRPNWLKLN